MEAEGFVVVSRVGYLLFTTHGKGLSVVVLGGLHWNSMSVCSFWLPAFTRVPRR